MLSHPALCARKLIVMDFIKGLLHLLTSDLVWMMEALASGWEEGENEVGNLVPSLPFYRVAVGCLPPSTRGTGPGSRSCSPARGPFSAGEANSSPAGPYPECCTTLEDFLTNALAFK